MQFNQDFVLKEWEELLTKATEKLEIEAPEQVVVMQSAKDEIYCIAFSDLQAATEGAIPALEQATAGIDTKIVRVVCMWRNGGIDLPSYALRDRLCKLNRENLDAQLLLQRADSPIIKRIADTMPASYAAKHVPNE